MGLVTVTRNIWLCFSSGQEGEESWGEKLINIKKHLMLDSVIEGID